MPVRVVSNNAARPLRHPVRRFRSRARIAGLPRDAAKDSEYRFPRERFNRRKEYKSASSPCAKEVLALRDLP
jgi:hypothetical protein